jgi:hypothetical protein
MKYIKLFENFDQSEISKICKEYKIKYYTINQDGSIDVLADDDFYQMDLTKIPLEFNRIVGWDIVDLFNGDLNIYLNYQETYNFLRKDFKIVKHRLEEAIEDFNEYYDKQVELPKEIKYYTYI